MLDLLASFSFLISASHAALRVVASAFKELFHFKPNASSAVCFVAFADFTAAVVDSTPAAWAFSAASVTTLSAAATSEVTLAAAATTTSSAFVAVSLSVAKATFTFT